MNMNDLLQMGPDPEKRHPLPENWTLSEPTPIMHGQWFATFYQGRRMSLVLIEDTDGLWMIQNEGVFYQSAADAINAAVSRAWAVN